MKKCPECDGGAHVLETRQQPGYTRRRYECSNGHRYTTMEMLEIDYKQQEKIEAHRRLNAALNSVRGTMMRPGHGFL